MTIKMYMNNEQLVAGMSLKDELELENNNMALHVCKNIDNVIVNREKLANHLNCRLDNFVCANQTHSANFHRVTVADAGRGADRIETAIPDTDALYTYEPNPLLCSFTADCVPVIFYHETTGLVGVIHSGWQGTVKEITERLFNHLKQEEQCRLDRLHVIIGPALSQEKFEVDEDVYIQFKELGYADEFIYFNHVTGKYHIDNQRTVQRQCERAGIPTEHILVDPTCTFKNPNGFSYRQDKSCGRHVSFIMRKDD